MRILIVEDEESLAEDIGNYLQSARMICSFAPSVEDAKEALALYRFDVILVDVGLPDGNGLDLIKLILKSDQKAGVLVISAKNSLDDKISGLDLGADDYITKPFHLAELQSRIQSVFRRKQLNGKLRLSFGNIELIPGEYRALAAGKELDLSPKEFQLLQFFFSNPSKVLTKEAIAEHLWGEEADNMDDLDFIYSHVKNLRKKISLASGDDRIKSIYGIGYKFVVE